MKSTSFLLKFIAYVYLLSSHFLLDAATVTSLAPFSGPSSGGTIVTIVGSGFTGTTAVNFGTTPAASFIVNSDNMITAISPSHSPQVVGVSVTAPSGISPISPDSLFAFQGTWQIYVNNNVSDTVTAIDTSTDTIVGIPPVETFPVVIHVTPDGTRTYALNLSGPNFSVIDTATNTTLVSNFAGGIQPSSIAITPNGIKGYITFIVSDNVGIIDIATNTLIANPFVGLQPQAVIVIPNGTKAYVANTGSNTVSILSTASDTVIQTVAVGATPISLTFTPDGSRVYVVNSGDNTVSVIDTLTDTVIATIPVGLNPHSIAINSSGTTAYISNLDEDTISVIDIATNTVVTTIPVGVAPDYLIVTPDTTKVYVVNLGNSNVSVIDAATNTVIATIPVGNSPTAIAITPDGTKVYVTSAGDIDVSVIDTATDTVITTIPVAIAPTSISITPDQAPLAKFTFVPGIVGMPTIFDASSSVSPVGSIVNYFWDFGDGTTFSTSIPLTEHIYAAPGAYNVTLTVTNSAGTSTTQVFNPSFGTLTTLFTTTSSFDVLKNGGPSATLTRIVTILSPVPVVPLPPQDLRARQVKNKFATQTDLINILTWRAPTSGATPVAYQIFRNKQLTKLAATISADDPLRFEDHNRRKGRTYTYFIVSVDSFGNQSSPVKIVLRGKR